MSMALQTRAWRRADLDRLPNDGNRYEVVGGELLVTPPPSVAHERLHQALLRILLPYVERHGLGEIFNGSFAVILGEDHVEPDLMVSPPVVPRPQSWIDMPKPRLIVEVLSPTTVRRDQVAKRELYVRSGIPEYWIVDPEARTIRVIRPDGTDPIETTVLLWQLDRIPAPLTIDVAALFRECL